MKDKKLVVKMTLEELQSLRHDAYKHEKNVSEYIRWLIERERRA